jgi:hypothetical protein
MFADELDFTLSAGAGLKTIYLELKSATGTVSDPLVLELNYITDGPVISSFSLVEGQQLGRPLTVAAAATAALGLSGLELFVDNEVVGAFAEGTLRWDLRELDTGTHRVRLQATDDAGNIATRALNVEVDVQAPTIPTITIPAADVTIPEPPLGIAGTAEPLVDVQIRRNSLVVATLTADAQGAFALAEVPLIEGNNLIRATAIDHIGSSTPSAPRTIVLDSGAPAPVEIVAAIASRSGVFLNWQYADVGERPVEFLVYRHNAYFTNTAFATLIASGLTQLNFDDQPNDGTWYYGVVGVDGAGNRSELSNVADARFDTTPPEFTVSFDSAMPVGVGALGITVSANEPIYGTPNLVIIPFESYRPQQVALERTGGSEFTAVFDVTTSTNSGVADVFVGGQDSARNGVNGPPAGPVLEIDTTAPTGAVTTTPGPPIQVQTNVEVSVDLLLDEAPGDGQTPSLEYRAPDGTDVDVPLTGSGLEWAGTLTLEPGTGDGFGEFSLVVTDALGNEGTDMTEGSTLEVYTGDLPQPPVAPTGLTAESLPSGAVRLSWDAVANAQSYRLYRAASGSEPETRVATDIVGTTTIDVPPTDGDYDYAVSGFRYGAEGAPSEIATGTADSVPPGAPEAVSLSSLSSGILIEWQPPTARETPAYYTVYRNGVPIGPAVFGLLAVDYPGFGGVYTYTVGASDAAGNEALSAGEILSMAVGAVSNLRALAAAAEAPVLSWTATDPATAGFNVYRGGALLTAEPVLAPSFTDDSYSGTAPVTYEVRGVNDVDEEGPGRTVTVHPVTLSLTPEVDGDAVDLVAGYFGRFRVGVTNRAGAAALPIHRFVLQEADGPVVSRLDIQNLAAGETYTRDLPYPIDADLRVQEMELRVVRQGELGSGEVTYSRTFRISDVLRPDDMIAVGTSQVPLAGGLSTVELCILNPGHEAIDVVLSRFNNAQPGDLRLVIRDVNGLELRVVDQLDNPDAVPGVQVLPDSRRYVRIAPRGSVCVSMNIIVPEQLRADDIITFDAQVTQYYHDINTATQIVHGPLDGSLSSGIVLSPYYGEATVDGDLFANESTVRISGVARDRETNELRPNVPLRIGVAVRGFHWFFETETDGAGNFVYDYVPSFGLSGEFTIWAAHPDVVDQLSQDTFTLFRMYASPVSGEIRMSKGDTFHFNIALQNPSTLPLSSVGVAFRAYTVDGEGLETTVDSVTGGLSAAADALGPRALTEINLELTTAIEAPDVVNVEFTFTTAEGAVAVWPATVFLEAAVPIIDVTSPSVGYVEMSVDRGRLASRTVTIVNNGLNHLYDAELLMPENIAWMTTNLTPAEGGQFLLGDIMIGESRSFDVVFAPPSTTEFGFYDDVIGIRGSNDDTVFEVGLYAQVTSNLTGAVHFKVIDMLAQPIPNAKVRIKSPLLNRELSPARTDANGEVTIDGLQEGSWSFQITASGYGSYVDSVDVIPDQTVVVDDFFLIRSLVTIEFTVVPVPFTDRYEIKIEQTFETHVPVPTLRIDPPQKTFEEVVPGFTTTFIARVHNEGLVSAFDLTLSSHDVSYGTLEPLITYVPELGARQTLDVPYRVVYHGTGDEGAARVNSGNAALDEEAENLLGLLDCVTGGFMGTIQAFNTIRNLQSNAVARGYCPAGDINLDAALALILIAQAVSFFGTAYLGTLVSCLAQQIGRFLSGGGGGGGGGGSGGGGGRMGTGFGGGWGCP